MLRLDSTVRKLQIVLGGAITTNQLPVVVCYSDKTSTAYSGGTTPSNTNSTTAVDICAAPAASTVRDIDSITVYNADTAAATATIRYNDNGTTYTLFKAALAVGDQLVYTHGSGWLVRDSAGAEKILSPASYKLSAFAATTSAELASVISDETGSGALVFAAAPTFTSTVNITGKATLGVGTPVSHEVLGNLYFTRNDGPAVIGSSMDQNLQFQRNSSTRLTLISDGVNIVSNLGINVTTFGTSAVGVLAVKNGTVPSTTPTDTVQIFAEDISAGNSCLCWRQEAAVTASAATASTHKVPTRINGTTYYLLVTNV